MENMALNLPNACQIDCSVVQLPPIEFSTRPTVLQRAGQIDEAINNMWQFMRDRREGEKKSEARWKSLSLELLADKALVSRMGMGREKYHIMIFFFFPVFLFEFPHEKG